MGIDIKSLPKPIRAFFNGIGQVVFIENVIAGFLIFISFFIAGLEMNGWDFGNWYSWRIMVFALLTLLHISWALTEMQLLQDYSASVRT